MRSVRTYALMAALLTLAGLSACAQKRGVYHEVQRGETLSVIARGYDMDPELLAIWNGVKDPNRINVGDRLWVPGAQEPVHAARKPQAGDKASDAPPPRRSSGERVASVEPAPRAVVKSPPIRLIWPLEKPKMLSAFGPRSGRNHDGLDLGAPKGTKIRAAADGRVIYAGDGLRGYGNLIIIRHTGNWATVYAHNDENLVEKDDFIRAGEVVATVGDTGAATTPHLHFELRDGKQAIDPMPYLP
ncbi:MAG: peptidoglycan DD-metalloendopeptidase family protein [Deltaproteobacteria bacterium]|nr:peptidoglycan DD-metalloendopeptidase family protein [Deltaproteobacteria bacterium]